MNRYRNVELIEYLEKERGKLSYIEEKDNTNISFFNRNIEYLKQGIKKDIRIDNCDEFTEMRKLIRGIAKYFMEIEECKCDLIITFKKNLIHKDLISEGSLTGGTHHYNKYKRTHKIVLNGKYKESWGTSNMISTLFHELVHLRQIEQGDYKYSENDSNIVFWNNEKYIRSETPYRERPWEIEAFREQNQFACDFIEYNRRNFPLLKGLKTKHL